MSGMPSSERPQALHECTVPARVSPEVSTGAMARWRSVFVQLVVFASVGAALNVLYGLLYLVLREQLSAQPANALALILSTIAGTFAHRYVTFGVRGTDRTVQHQVLGLALLGFSLAVTAGSLWLLDTTVAQPSRRQEVVVLIAANLGTGLVRFFVFRVAMVGRRGVADARETTGSTSSPTRPRP
jgi:putative flippase GtrA